MKAPIQQPTNPFWETIDEKLPGAGLFMDIICTRDSTHYSWKYINKYFEVEGPKVKVKIVIVNNETPTSEETLQDVTNSFFHRFGARPHTFPYTNMVRWVVETTYITERKLQTQKHTTIGLFIENSFQEMYHLPDPQWIYDKKYAEKFFKKHGDPTDSIKEQRSDPNKHKKEEYGKYYIDSLTYSFNQVVDIL